MVQRIVVGLPLHLDGTPSEMSEEVKNFSERLRKALGIRVELMDERLSSWEAKQTVSALEPRRQALRGSQARASKESRRLRSTMSPRRSSCGIIWNGRAARTERETDMRRAFLFFLFLLTLAAGYLYVSLTGRIRDFPRAACS